MSLETLPLPALSTSGTDREVDHEICCIDPTIGMCGTALGDSPIGAEMPTCVVCRDLLETWVRNADLHGEAVRRVGAQCVCGCLVCPKRRTEASR